MFILAPSLVILISVIGIAIIILRKKTYLNKLYALNMAGNGSDNSLAKGSKFKMADYGAELFPEIAMLLKKIKIAEHKDMWLMEAEKLLRRTRLIFLRIDRLSDSLIKKIRRVHVNGKLNGSSVDQNLADKEEVREYAKLDPAQTISPVFLKNEEEKLIMEIAKNPKDGKLYEALGDLYVEMENWTDAKESYEASIELIPQDDSIRQKLSSAIGKITSHN